VPVSVWIAVATCSSLKMKQPTFLEQSDIFLKVDYSPQHQLYYQLMDAYAQPGMGVGMGGGGMPPQGAAQPVIPDPVTDDDRRKAFHGEARPRKPKVTINDISEDLLRFTLDGCDVGVANGLRRAILAEVR